MKENESRKTGISANALIIPIAVVIALLHIIVVAIVFDSNRSNSELSGLMQDSSDYQQYSTNLQAGTSVLSETATAFVQMPLMQDGAFNVGALGRYAQELGMDRRGEQIAQWFRDKKVDGEIQAYVDEAAQAAEQMSQRQLHAIALVSSVYPRPDIPELSAIPQAPLTEEELAMPEEARLELARGLILSPDFSLLKSSVAENIESCHRVVQMEYAVAAARSQRHIASLRLWLWVVILAIILILTGTFILVYRWVILPLRRYAVQIAYDRSLDQNSRVREMRLVVSAYNALLKRHDKLESILRSAAETDALTDLPNRYSMEQYVLENGEDERSMAVLLFDVNFLKQTNDTQGHMAGDKLLRATGACIRECFETEGGLRCYRIGGDEFAAVLHGCGEEEIRERIARFRAALERERISVSTGYAYAARADEGSFNDLMKLADERMYAQKKLDHERFRDGVR